MSALTREAVLEQFDRLQREGELFYASTTPIKQFSGGLEFEFRIVPSFTSKPQLNTDGSKTQTAQSARRPPPSDGSDIDHADPAFFVAYVAPNGDISTDVNAFSDSSGKGIASKGIFTHKLILNKFCVFRPQYLLLTTDPLQRQTSRLNEADLQAAWNVLSQFAASSPHYVIFNCGREGGSSRKHKHMQVLEVPAGGEDRALLWPGLADHRIAEEPIETGPYETLPLPFITFRSKLRKGYADATDLKRVYSLQYEQCCEALQRKVDEDVPHNVVLTKDWLVTIPRRRATTEGIYGHIVNATGMVGLVWCGDEGQLAGWSERGPANVLGDLGCQRV